MKDRPFARPARPPPLDDDDSLARDGGRDGHCGGHRTAAAWRPGVAPQGGSPIERGAPRTYPPPRGLCSTRAWVVGAPRWDSPPSKEPPPTAASGGRRLPIRGSADGAGPHPREASGSRAPLPFPALPSSESCSRGPHGHAPVPPTPTLSWGSQRRSGSGRRRDRRALPSERAHPPATAAAPRGAGVPAPIPSLPSPAVPSKGESADDRGDRLRNRHHYGRSLPARRGMLNHRLARPPRSCESVGVCDSAAGGLRAVNDRRRLRLRTRPRLVSLPGEALNRSARPVERHRARKVGRKGEVRVVLLSLRSPAISSTPTNPHPRDPHSYHLP